MRARRGNGGRRRHVPLAMDTARRDVSRAAATLPLPRDPRRPMTLLRASLLTLLLASGAAVGCVSPPAADGAAPTGAPAAEPRPASPPRDERAPTARLAAETGGSSRPNAIEAGDDAPRLVARASAVVDTPPVAPAPAAPTLDGAWRLDRGASEDVDAAVRRATEGLSPFLRGTARDRLSRASAPASALRIATAEGAVTIEDGEGRALRAVPGGRGTLRTRRGDRDAQVSARRDGAGLVVTLRTAAATRVETYAPSADGGTLRLTVAVTGDRLPQPLRYALVYRREETGGAR
jgi:hypothetical protein